MAIFRHDDLHLVEELRVNDVQARPRKRRSLSGVTSISHQRAAAPRAATLIYQHLLEDIVTLRRKPMDLLNEKELAEHFGVSRTPIREAIIRLSDDGLVDVFPQSGTFVSRIPRRALYEAILIRKSLENTNVSLAIEKATPADLDGLDRLLKEQAECREAGDYKQFHELDTAFHRQINVCAGFPGIWTMIQQVKVHIDRYRLLTLPQEGRLLRVVEEHKAVVDGLRRRDAASAVDAMEFHLGQMLREIDDITDLNPAYFIDDDKRGPSGHQERADDES
ncbi:GntR family transcriptional regulator [Shinella sp. 838]|uniref:GntR family transcriptional regulator n=1 Tax=Shinella sp. 838 TaxID=3038164 RepID=UPI002415668C|nr:GntR family transcriptional regulator [Shinella sp. 838]MDG4674813.1 GntR family transcriptional regulator [Shinella sp. 838]